MDGPGHYEEAENLAEQARRLLDREYIRTAAACAAIAQVHATLALAAAAGVKTPADEEASGGSAPSPPAPTAPPKRWDPATTPASPEGQPTWEELSKRPPGTA